MVFKIRDFLKRVDHVSFLQRTFIVFLLFGAFYSVYYLLVKKPASTQKPEVSKSSIKVSLNQHLLATRALRDIDVNDISTPYKIEGVRSNIDKTLEDYKREVSEFSEKSNDFTQNNTEEFESEEQKILASYDSAYNELKNLILYSLYEDIGQLNKSTEIQEITARSDIAISSIKNIKENSKTLSKESSLKIDKALTCMGDIKSKTSENKTENLEKLIGECEKDYTSIKPFILNDILRPLKTKEADNYFDNLRRLLDQL